MEVHFMYKKLMIFLMALLTVSVFSNGKEETATEAEMTRPLWHMNSFAQSGFPMTKENNPILAYMVEETGIDIKIEAYSYNDFETKLQLYFASGDYPDFWHHGGPIALNTLKWKDQGVIRPVGNLLDQYGPNVKKMLYDDALEAVTYDGEIYAVPAGFNKNDPAGSPNANGFIMRKDWLDNLGLTEPETLDELHTVLTAFTRNDPDGNGKNDTYGMGTDKNYWGINIIINAFGVNPGHWYEKEGKLVKGELTQRYLEALEVARQWYEEGLIDPEFAALIGKDVETRIVNGKIGSTMANVWWPHPRWRLVNPMKDQTPEAELVMISAVQGPYGDRGYGPGSTLTQTNWISAETPYAAQVMQLFNWLGTGDNHLIPRIGLEGVDWEWNAEHNNYNLLSDVTTDMNAAILYGLGNAGRFWPVIDRTKWRPEIEPYFDAINAHILENKFIGAVPAMSEYSDVDSILSEAAVLFIIGQEDLDYVKAAQEKWYKEGGQAITDEVNDFYYN
jgi:putative aldouronate transport system substrate-binding protein